MVAICWPGRRINLALGEVMRHVDGPIVPVDCVSQSRPKVCEFPGGCKFFPFWGRVRQAISDVVDKTTFADLIRESHERGSTPWRGLDHLKMPASRKDRLRQL